VDLTLRFSELDIFGGKKEDVQKTNSGTRMHLASLEEITASKVRYILNYHVERQ
jgi:hypothetical protein